MSKYILPSGVVKACAGIVESVAAEPYAGYIKQAETIIGVSYAGDFAAQAERARLVEAIKHNLVNRQEYSYQFLARRYNLPVSLATFKREKRRFCYELAKQCGFIK